MVQVGVGWDEDPSLAVHVSPMGVLIAPAAGVGVLPLPSPSARLVGSIATFVVFILSICKKWAYIHISMMTAAHVIDGMRGRPSHLHDCLGCGQTLLVGLLLFRPLACPRLQALPCSPHCALRDPPPSRCWGHCSNHPGGHPQGSQCRAPQRHCHAPLSCLARFQMPPCFPMLPPPLAAIAWIFLGGSACGVALVPCSWAIPTGDAVALPPFLSAWDF